MKKQIQTDGAPAAIGPYSQAIVVDRFVFVSGQLGINPETGEMPTTVVEQARQSLTNIRTILEAAGSSLCKVVKTTVFLQNMDDFGAMNDVYREMFEGSVFPARSAVAVRSLPKDALVEIEVIATLE